MLIYIYILIYTYIGRHTLLIFPIDIPYWYSLLVFPICCVHTVRCLRASAGKSTLSCSTQEGTIPKKG